MKEAMQKFTYCVIPLTGNVQNRQILRAKETDDGQRRVLNGYRVSFGVRKIFWNY